MHVPAVEAVGGERRQFEKRGARIEQQIDALARQQLAARGMFGARRLAAAGSDRRQLVVQFGDQRPHRIGIAREIGRTGIDLGVQRHGVSGRF